MIITLHITHVKNLHISYLRFKDTMETSMTQNTIHVMSHSNWSCSMYKIFIPGRITEAHPQVYDGQDVRPVLRLVVPADGFASQRLDDRLVDESVGMAQESHHDVADDDGGEQIRNQDDDLAGLAEKLAGDRFQRDCDDNGKNVAQHNE